MITNAKMRRAMRTVAARKGDFTLFALLRRPDALGRWDLVVSAPWLRQATLRTMREFAKSLATSMGKKEFLQLARIQPVDGNDPTVKAILADFPIEDGELRVPSSTLFGLQFDEGIIFRAKKPSPARIGSRAKCAAASHSQPSRGSTRQVTSAKPKKPARPRFAAGR